MCLNMLGSMATFWWRSLVYHLNIQPLYCDIEQSQATRHVSAGTYEQSDEDL